MSARGRHNEPSAGRSYAFGRGLGAPSRAGLCPGDEENAIELRLVARLHVDLLRVSSAGCRRSR